MDILKIKNQAINETLEYFKSYELLFKKKGYKIQSETELLNYLNSEHKQSDYIRVIKKHDKFSVIDKDDLEKEIILKLKEYQNSKDIFNENGITNSFYEYAFHGMIKDYCTICFWFEYYYEFLEKLRLRGNPNKVQQIKQFSDILEDNYKNKEDDIFAILGTCFPEYYDENGKAVNNKKNIKAILNSWYKLLFSFNIISLNPTNQQKEQICQILNDRCKFVNGKLSSKTLFENDGIEIKLKSEYRTMQILIKSLKIN